MPSPRNYNGLVAFNRELWLVGGDKQSPGLILTQLP